MMDFIEKYGKKIGTALWTLLLLYVVIIKYDFNILLITQDLLAIISSAYVWTVALPGVIWDAILNLIEQGRAFLIALWEDRSWGKVGKFVGIGIFKRFVIEDIIIALIMLNFIPGFKESLGVFLKVKLDRLNELSSGVKFFFYTVFIAPIATIIATVVAWTQAGAIAWFWIKKIFLNKILSLLKWVMLKLVPWVFTFVIDSSTLLALIIEYVITMQLVKLLLMIPGLGWLLKMTFGKLWEGVQWLDNFIKTKAIAWPKGKLKNWGVNLGTYFENKVVTSKKWETYEEAHEHFRKKARLKKANKLRRQRKGLFRKVRVKVRKAKNKRKKKIKDSIS